MAQYKMKNNEQSFIEISMEMAKENNISIEKILQILNFSEKPTDLILELDRYDNGILHFLLSRY